MELENIVNHVANAACICAVEKRPDGSCGDIYIAAGNDEYKKMGGNGSPEYVPWSLYTRYIPRDLNFEDFVYRCAVGRRPLHTCVKVDYFDFWMNVFAMPLDIDDDKYCYCVYTYERMEQADSDLMASLPLESSHQVLATMLKLRSSDDFDVAMDLVIRDIRKLCGAENCCIILMPRGCEQCTLLAASSTNENNQRIMKTIAESEGFFKIAQTWKDALAGSNCIIIKNDRDMEVLGERTPLWHKSLTSFGVKSLVLFPLKSSGKTLGYIWATDFDVNKSEHIKTTLELTSLLIASEIASHLLLIRLREMSNTDQLTGLNNRNAMDMIVSSLPESEDLGIVFADLNGLKAVNDTLGHKAGDGLLRAAAELLRKAFPGKYIVRMGGDEFMVIVTGVTRSEFEGMVKELGELTAAHESVSMAIGAYFDDTDHDVRRAMQTADRAMYEDKQRYYQEMG